MTTLKDVAIYEPLDQKGIYLVHSPHTTIQHTCDIIIVHGLNGGTARSFTHSQTGTIWFQHLLPDDVVDSETRTNARIWVYGYNADTTFENAGNTTAFDQATNLLESVRNVRKTRRKVIWVCHSLGGIIVKTALFQANSKDRYRAILEDTIGTIFIGTPHQGSGYANVAEIAQQIARVVLFKPKAIVTGLKKNCHQLFETANNFADVSGKIKIFCFYETIRPEIVTKDSASTRIPGEVLLALEDVKHTDLCKFRDHKDPNYRRVRDSIKELMRMTVSISRPAYFPWDGNPYGGRSQPGYVANTKSTRAPAFEPTRPPYPTDSTPSASYTTYRRPVGASQPPWSSPPNGLQVPGHGTHDRSPSYSPSNSPSTDRPVSSHSYASTATRDTFPPSPNPSQPHSRSPSTDKSTSSQSVPTMDNRSPLLSGYRTTRSETNVSRASSPSREEQPHNNRRIWTCDFCMDDIPEDKPRAHCMVCNDYDLCIDCNKKDRTSKAHQPGHKMRLILRTKVIASDDFAFPGDAVNPYLPPEDKDSNWAIDEKDKRWDNLRKTDNHDRYFASNIGPGYYRPDLVLRLKLSKHLNAGSKAALSKDGIGKLRITIGFPKSKDIFLHNSFPENENLKDQLFNAKVMREITLLPAHEGTFKVDLGTARITLDQPKTELGILLQWTGMRGFVNLDDPIAQIGVEQLRLEDLFDRHTESAPSTSQAPAKPQAATAGADDAEKLGELFAEILIESAKQNQKQEEQKRMREQQARDEAAAQFIIQAATLQAAREAQENRERQARMLAIRRQQQQQQQEQEAVDAIVGYAYLAALLDKSNR